MLQIHNLKLYRNQKKNHFSNFKWSKKHCRIQITAKKEKLQHHTIISLSIMRLSVGSSQDTPLPKKIKNKKKKRMASGSLSKYDSSYVQVQ